MNHFSHTPRQLPLTTSSYFWIGIQLLNCRPWDTMILFWFRQALGCLRFAFRTNMFVAVPLVIRETKHLDSNRDNDSVIVSANLDIFLNDNFIWHMSWWNGGSTVLKLTLGPIIVVVCDDLELETSWTFLADIAGLWRHLKTKRKVTNYCGARFLSILWSASFLSRWHPSSILDY